MQLIENATDQKLRGAYYTPPVIAKFILQWGINGNNNLNILEPSCGDGVFLECISNNKILYNSVTAVEYEVGEAEKARAIPLHDSEVINEDFHRFCLDTDKRFNLVVGNPPFIRYQYYDAEQQKLADEIFKRSKLKRTKLTNAWVTFVVGCSQLLTETSKMGFVIPSELLMVKYAQQLRQYLAKSFNKINIISFENLVFEEIQQEVVLLLCEKNGTDEHLIEHIEVKDADSLLTLDPRRLKFPTKKIDFHTDKWTYYFLEKEELDLLEKVKHNMPSISTYANVEVGITTGANDYFTVPKSVVTLYNLEEYAKPMVGRSVQVNSLCFTKKDWLANVELGAKAHLLVFPSGVKENGNDGVKAYINNGEKEGINNGYKTGIRDEWYIIPSIKLSDALFLRRNNQYPKFVLNEAKAYTTDTMHRVFIKEGVNKKAFVASYYNSLSFTFAEILGRNFGGGCLELMPSEVGDIYMPYRVENETLFAEIDKMLRHKRTADEILDYTDRAILHEGMGLSMEEVQTARSIWHKIMGRRLSRETLEKKKEVNVEKKAKFTHLDFLDLFEQYQDNNIVDNSFAHEDISEYVTSSRKYLIDGSKNVLISLVKKDNFNQYLDKSAKIYYTGKKFPSKVALNKLYYFMPYLKGKGIRDLYLIKIARVGTRKEGQLGENKDDLRLVFEIEYVAQLFDDYQVIDLKIWRTFTDTTINDLLKQKGYDLQSLI
ncbi:class I SAM-dependent methyltransferase [Phocaeicola plebeius]|jgi:adenine-specific DNA-methyltransferase|uniref:site-specific DNA-methyltransferase (adenine-specific) n=1 Tax=Phocaeicola plebeius TaxID=310297 RepID=A0A415T9L7_9BACT|nr:class I SAM-dependent methyltransferase [Phocaeicola plebeius]RHA34438.1 class I SAM-dependent methyltransferase [Phocaeicola plebeius]RHA36558.1 class I SAM-dependent methyltransferase [Phocaeicola plebeius]RHM97981.1 class I SAM-dependent methyltransferase [Phocaeicola plebeius]